MVPLAFDPASIFLLAVIVGVLVIFAIVVYAVAGVAGAGGAGESGEEESPPGHTRVEGETPESRGD